MAKDDKPKGAKGVSMEEFGPIAADYFVGRKVESVTEGDNEAVWSINFEAGGTIHNYDPTLPKPKAIVDSGLTMLILGTHKSEYDRTPLTELRFGLESVQLNPLQYAMYDPVLTKGQIVFAQRSNANMPVVPEYPAEREWDGPEE